MATINAVGVGLSGASGTGNFAGNNSPSLTTPKINQVNDVNGNPSLAFNAASSAVNYLAVGNSAAAAPVFFQALGNDTNIAISYVSKGNESHQFYTTATTRQILVLSGAAYANSTILNFPVSDQFFTFPEASGTIALTSSIPTGAALTKTDDTNVTLTLGGSPTTALVNAASLTLGWTGQLAVSRGGTGISSFGTGVATALGQNVSGSGGMALTTSPTFVTPTLGAASATSINFGGTSLANYLEGSITPTIVSSGGGSVTYSFQGGAYTRIGNRVIFNFQMGLATNSLSAGTITLAGLPTNCVGNVAVSIWCVTLNVAAITQIMGYVVNGTTTIALSKYAAGSTTSLADTDLAATTTFIVSGSYPV